ncbi:MAG: hypothetical protein R3C11_15575 [Planctomycetaceae bacterium]
MTLLNDPEQKLELILSGFQLFVTIQFWLVIRFLPALLFCALLVKRFLVRNRSDSVFNSDLYWILTLVCSTFAFYGTDSAELLTLLIAFAKLFLLLIAFPYILILGILLIRTWNKRFTSNQLQPVESLVPEDFSEIPGTIPPVTSS